MNTKSEKKALLPKKILKLFSEFTDLIFWFDAQLTLMDIWIKESESLPAFALLKEKMKPEALVDKNQLPYFYQELEKVILGEHVPEMYFEINQKTNRQYISLKPILIKKTRKKYVCVTGQLIDTKNYQESYFYKRTNIYAETLKLAKIGSWEINWLSNSFWISEELQTILNPQSVNPINTVSAFIAYVHPEDKHFAKKSFNIQNQSHTKQEISFRVLRSDSTIIYLKQIYLSFYNDEQKLCRTIGSIIDITESKEIELTLHQKKSEIERQNTKYQLLNKELELAISLAASSSEYFQKIFDEAPVGILLFANDGKITNCNHYFCEITGKKKDTILEFKLLDSKFTKEINELVINTFKNKYAWFEGKCASLSNNKNLIFKIKTTVVKDSKLKIELGIALVENITQIAEFQEKLEVARVKAEESNKLKSAFLANMSHEIRTPLNAILGFTQILKEKQPDSAKREKFLTVIHSSGIHLLNLINDVLDLSKIEAGQMELDNTYVELNELFEETLHIFQSYKLNQHKAHIKILLSIPPEKKVFYTDRTKFIQILNNLISNAIRFTTEGFVHFGFEISGTKLIVFVEDTGVGIHPDEHKLIFERFRQSAYSGNNASGGTGLGLALVKAFSEMMQGTISLHSLPGKGSTFKIAFDYNGSI